jgi:hypothetical protein
VLVLPKIVRGCSSKVSAAGVRAVGTVVTELRPPSDDDARDGLKPGRCDWLIWSRGGLWGFGARRVVTSLRGVLTV